MKILFLDKKTGEKAKLNESCTQFVIDEDGIVCEVCEQSYANFFALLARDDVYADIQTGE